MARGYPQGVSSEEIERNKPKKSLINRIGFVGKCGILGAAVGLSKTINPDTDIPLDDISKIYDNLIYLGNAALKGAAIYTGAAYMLKSGFMWLENKYFK